MSKSPPLSTLNDILRPHGVRLCERGSVNGDPMYGVESLRRDFGREAMERHAGSTALRMTWQPDAVLLVANTAIREFAKELKLRSTELRECGVSLAALDRLIDSLLPEGDGK